MTADKFEKRVLSLLQSKLDGLGFLKKRVGISCIDLSPDTIGWVGFNTAVYRGVLAVDVNPVVGVRNRRIEKLTAKLCETPYDTIRPPTLAGNIGYMMPHHHYQKYFFSENSSCDKTADELVNAIEEHGMPFLKKNSDISSLLESLRTVRFVLPDVARYRIPVGLFLMDQGEEAKKHLTGELSLIGNRTDAAALHYLNFAARLSELL